jgi:glucose-6-phosphate isomerase
MLYQHLTDACFEEQLGTHGVSRKRVDELLSQLTGAFSALQLRSNHDAAPLLNVPARTDDIERIETLAKRIRSAYDTVVVAGTGGSGLSGRALTHLLPLGSKPKLYYLENIDPDTMDEVLAHVDLKKTCFLVISKSGSTAETLAQFYVLLDYVSGKIGKAASEHFFVITMPGDNPTRQLAQLHGIEVLDHDPIGGRFSILTSVGLLPAAIAGLDIKALRRGARTVMEEMDKAAQPKNCAAALGAALQTAFIEKKMPISVMLPYSERFTGLAAWWRQGWAESLGKQGKGSTPVCSMGTTDQHSQLQLYLDGPKDKFFTMVMLDRAGQGKRVENKSAPEYMRGKTLGAIMAAEQKATFETLVSHKCPVRMFQLAALKEEQVGALLMHFMIEIILAASLLNVNPFDQPAVEEGKKLARDYLLAGKL